jgi:peptide/nickel transport system substrate-binding protein
VFIGVSLLAAACGDDDDDGDAGDTSTTEAPDSGGNAGGTITLGAEQFPECLNPITACANSSWMHWAVDEHVLPRLMELTPEGEYVPSPLLDGEPELAGDGIDDSGDPFTVTYTLHPDAAWSTGEPITCTDVAFTWQATLDSTGTLTTVGFDTIESIEATDDEDKVCQITFSEPYAAWADIMGSSSQYVLSAANSEVGADFDIADPDAFPVDIANELNTEIPYSGSSFVLEEFDAAGGEATFVRNDTFWDEERTALLDGFTMVALADQETELNALLAGEVAAIYPQPAPGIADTLEGGDTVEFQFGAGTTFEGLWFNQASQLNPDSALNDLAVREALLYAVNRDEILAEVITPSFPETEILNCGGWVPTVGEWCDNTDFADATFDPELVASTLEEGGWALGSDGVYAKDGQRLSITWQTVAGNARREQIQSLVIPALAELGIELVVDNSDADTLFQVRLPQMDTELALYAQVASPDPSVTTIFACENIPTPENEFSGQNNTGWCNEEATELMIQSDQTPDEAERLELIQQVGDFVREDVVWLPMYQLPLITAWDTALVEGPVGEFTDSPLSGFFNVYDWSVPA